MFSRSERADEKEQADIFSSFSIRLLALGAAGLFALLLRIPAAAAGSLLSILSAAGGGSSGNSRGRLSRKEQAHLAELHGYFSKLVDDLTASVQHLAMLDFNNWLVRIGQKSQCWSAWPSWGMAAIPRGF